MNCSIFPSCFSASFFVRLTRWALFRMNGSWTCVTCGTMIHAVAGCTELELTKGNSVRDFTEICEFIIETRELDRQYVRCGGCGGLIFCNDCHETRCDQCGILWHKHPKWIFAQSSGIYCCSFVVKFSVQLWLQKIISGSNGDKDVDMFMVSNVILMFTINPYLNVILLCYHLSTLECMPECAWIYYYTTLLAIKLKV